MSRTDPEELGFIGRIGVYAHAKLRVGVLLDCPLTSYSPGDHACPICREVAELERLATFVAQSGHGNTRLVQSIKDKAASSAVVALTLRGKLSLSFRQSQRGTSPVLIFQYFIKRLELIQVLESFSAML